MVTSGYILTATPDEGSEVQYFDGSTITANQAKVRIFDSPGEARAIAGILQKDYLQGTIAVKAVTITLVIS